MSQWGYVHRVAVVAGLGLLALSMVMRPGEVHAASITVDTTADVIANDGDCSLREAIINANNDDQSGSTDCAAGSGADTITLPAGAYTLMIAGSDLASALGALDIVNGSDVTITGAGMTSTFVQACTSDQLSGACAGGQGIADRVFLVAAGGVLTLQDLTVRHGRGSGTGGGIQNTGGLTLLRMALRDNLASLTGGGARSLGNTVITASVIAGNRAEGAGGFDQSAGNLTMTRTTVENNSSTATNPGGGLLLGGAGTHRIANSTISGNSSLAGLGGGGLYLGGSTISIINTTIASNTASTGNGHGLYLVSGTLTLTNSIIANGSTNGCFVNGGTLTDGGNNLVQDGSCAAQLGGALTGDPLLGALADNGGDTRTHALLAGSPARDAGKDAVCIAVPVGGVDQRGTSRTAGGTCDIGSYEVAFVASVPVPAFPRGRLTSGAGGDYTSAAFRLVVPPGAVPGDAEADVTEGTAAGPIAPLPGAVTAALDQAARILVRSADGSTLLSFAVPATVTFLAPALPSGGGTLVVLVYDGAGWRLLDTTVSASGAVSAQTSVTGTFVLARITMLTAPSLRAGVNLGTVGPVALEPATLIAALETQGCTPVSVWVTADGRLAGYIVGAPDAVNTGFPTPIPAGTPFLARCA